VQLYRRKPRDLSILLAQAAAIYATHPRPILFYFYWHPAKDDYNIFREVGNAKELTDV
jgi:hypothetical protein